MTTMTYKITRYSDKTDRETVDEGIRQGFKLWSDVTPLTFQQTHDDDIHDIDVNFSKTHPYFLTDLPSCAGVSFRNEIILNDLVFWSMDNSFSTIHNDGLLLKIKTHNLQSVTAHEIGHFFGLKHNDESDSIMRTPRPLTDRPSIKDIERLMEIINNGII